jgi:hypothetical protein
MARAPDPPGESSRTLPRGKPAVGKRSRLNKHPIVHADYLIRGFTLMLSSLLPTPIAKALGGLSLALALACAGLLLRGNYWHGRADSWEEVAGKWKDAQQKEETAYVAAQSEAKAKAEAARLATEAKSRVLAERADDDATISDLRAAAARHGDARRVPVHSEAAGSASSGAGTAGQAGAAAGGDGPGADAVVLSRVEFDQLVGNTLRLEQVRRWGRSLINAGLAANAE